MNEDFLDKKLQIRKDAHALRTLTINKDRIDFCSNDYLGIVKNRLAPIADGQELDHGSTGSRLLTGNYPLIEETERRIADFHQARSGLIFNSGYDANMGLLSSVPQKNDVILYDQLSHASLRDGIRLSLASSFSFLHNDLRDLEKKLLASGTASRIFVVTESVFSMDGDLAPLSEIVDLCHRFKAALIVDEAHATGVIGKIGAGLVQELGLQRQCFARIHTFSKALGTHGAIIMGSERLRSYLINFCRPFIYSTSLPPSAIAAIAASYNTFPELDAQRVHITELVENFKKLPLPFRLLPGKTPIQIVIIPGNEIVKKIAAELQEQHFDIRAILYPTVPREQERLRIVLHAFNTSEEVMKVGNLLASYTG